MVLNEDNLCFVFVKFKGLCVCVCVFFWTRKSMSHFDRYERFKIIIHVIMNKEEEEKKELAKVSLYKQRHVQIESTVCSLKCSEIVEQSL